MTESDFTNPRSAGAPDWEAVARHLAGESTAADSAAVSAWLSAHPEEARAIAAIGESSARWRAATDDVDVEAALSRVHERMRQVVTPVIPLQPAMRSVRRAPMAWGAAAAVVLLAVGLLWPRAERAPLAPRVLATAVGQMDSVRLADGTRIVLGPSSELRIDARYADGRRAVELKGTAFFQVQHDAWHRFEVRTSRAVITDLGTEFTVRGDGTDGVEVSVTEGAVRVQA